MPIQIGDYVRTTNGWYGRYTGRAPSGNLMIAKRGSWKNGKGGTTIYTHGIDKNVNRTSYVKETHLHPPASPEVREKLMGRRPKGYTYTEQRRLPASRPPVRRREDEDEHPTTRLPRQPPPASRDDKDDDDKDDDDGQRRISDETKNLQRMIEEGEEALIFEDAKEKERKDRLHSGEEVPELEPVVIHPVKDKKKKKKKKKDKRQVDLDLQRALKLAAAGKVAHEAGKKAPSLGKLLKAGVKTGARMNPVFNLLMTILPTIEKAVQDNIERERKPRRS